MYSINTFVVVVLFAGILNSAVVQAQVQGHQHGIPDSIFAHLKVPASLILWKKQCDQNGGPDAFVNVEQSEKMFTLCLLNAVQALRPELGAAIASTEKGAKIYAAEFCNQISHFKNCTPHLTEPLKACVEPKYLDAIDSRHDMLVSLMDFVCEDEASLIKEFLAGGGLHCMASKVTPFRSCIRQAVSDYVAHEAVESGNVPPLFGFEKCTMVDNVHLCTVRAWEECENEAPAYVLDYIFKFIKKSTPCKNFHESADPWSNNANVLSVSALTASAITVLRLM